jgi:type II secretory pathway component PulF
MPDTYEYTARTAEGEERTGLLEAESPERVAAVLAEQKLIPTEISISRTRQRLNIFKFLKARHYENLIIFTRNLSTLYRAGVPILRALSIIKIGPADGSFNRAIEKILALVEGGKSLSDAMSEFPDIFPRIYTASVAAGESSGKLDKILDSLGTMLEKDLALNRQIKSSIRYPIIVICAIAMAFMVLITFVIPRFTTFYAKMDADLPVPTKALIWTNHFISDYWIAIMAFIAVAFFVINRIKATENGRQFFDRLFLKLPIFGDLIIKGNVARFAYMFQILIKSGLPLVKSLELLSHSIRNSQIAAEILLLADSFREGREITGMSDKLKYFPLMALRMIQIGLESGSVDNMLAEVAIHYSREVDYKSRHLTALLEPILTVILGVFVLIVALAIFLPMWNLIQVFNK